MSAKLATLAKLIEIVKLTIETRKAQKAWFKNHLQSDLIRSKQLEQMLDTMLDGLVLPLEAEEPKQTEFGMQNSE
jgi:hypothetical protein